MAAMRGRMSSPNAWEVSSRMAGTSSGRAARCSVASGMVSRLPLEPGEGDALDERLLRQEEEDDNRRQHDDRGGHEPGPIDEVLAEKVVQTELQGVLVGVGEV